MNLNQPTLLLFEQERKKYDFFPPEESDSFYTIANASISLFHSNHKFILTHSSEKLHSGNGVFDFNNDLYLDTIVQKDAYFIIDQEIIVNNACLDIYGTLEIPEGKTLRIINDGLVAINPNAKIIINKNASIIIEDGAMNIYGTVEVDVGLMNTITSMRNLYIDSSSFITATGIDLGERELSLTDYDKILRESNISDHTIGEMNVEDGRVGYVWKGTSWTGDRQLEMNITFGTAVLGDYKLSILGWQEHTIPNLQTLVSFHVFKDTILYIAESYKGFTYLRPELYLGVVIDNVKTPAKCLIDGTVIVDGNDASITIDRKSTMIISETGSVYLQNGATIKSTNNDDSVILYINGTLTIDSIEQLQTFTAENIQFGENGKLIILNPSISRKILFSTPHGKYNSLLYKIFENTLDHVEYHLTKNTGIKIDEYFEYFSRDMTDWYDHMRIEKAIKEGLLIWEDGAFIELDRSIIPWATIDSTLLKATRIFKSFMSTDKQRLVDVAQRLKYCGFGNITFRFVEGNKYSDIIMHLEDSTMESITNSINENEYNLTVTDESELFIRNSVTNASESDIINNDAKMIHLEAGQNTISLL